MSIDGVHGDAAGFIDKWRARWPEWEIASVFVPEAQRPLAEAWFSLLQELTDAAWCGADPTPGLAKRAWWQEELGGWAKGARRHPLGKPLHSAPAPWLALGRALPDLRALRGDDQGVPAGAVAATPGEAFAAAVADCEAALFGGRADAAARSAVLQGLLGERALLRGDPASVAAAAAAGPGGAGAGRAAPGSRPRGVFAGLVAARVARPGRPVAPLRALFAAWRGARRAS